MRNNKNNHILTPTERVFYQRMAIEGTQRIIEECWKIINDEKDEKQELKIMALHLALDGNVQVAEMLKSMKQQYYHDYHAAGHDYDYGP